jgi:Zn-dependent protease with chaperone function
MEISDQKFRTLLESLENEAQNHPRRHALRMIGVLLVGYAFPVFVVLFCLNLAIQALVFGVLEVRDDSVERMVFKAILFFGPMAIATYILRAFYVKMPKPQYLSLRPDEAPALWQLVEEVRHVVGGPKIDEIQVTMNLNASALSYRKYGGWGRRRNYLIFGLPLLSVLTPDELGAVIGHEFGHLQGRNTRIASWVGHVDEMWEKLANPFHEEDEEKYFMMKRFVRWYKRFLGFRALALRRQCEYDADRLCAQVAGEAFAAQTLLKIDWMSYRMRHSFWPSLLHEAKTNPLPPADILDRMHLFLTSMAEPQELERWRESELKLRTPITDVHPSLYDRLGSLHRADLLLSFGDERDILPEPLDDVTSPYAMALLGDSQLRVAPILAAMWKSQVMQRWRHEMETAHEMAMEAAEKQQRQSQPDEEILTTAQQWDALVGQLRDATREQTLELLGAFTLANPDHAQGNFELGSLLMDQHDEAALPLLEQAMARNSEYALSSLEMMLSYYRQIGDDSEADRIRRELLQFSKTLEAAQKERDTVCEQDRYVPHDLTQEQIQRIREVLFFLPRIKCAYAVRRLVQYLVDQPNYVIALEVPARLWFNAKSRNKRLVDVVAGSVGLPCTVVILTPAAKKIRERLMTVCYEPVYVAMK